MFSSPINSFYLLKVSPSELAARASPTAPRRSDLPKIDSNLLSMHSQQQFPLPPSITTSAAAAMMQHHRAMTTMGGSGGPGSGGGGDSGSDAEDLRVPSSSPFGGSTGSGGGILVFIIATPIISLKYYFITFK